MKTLRCEVVLTGNNLTIKFTNFSDPKERDRMIRIEINLIKGLGYLSSYPIEKDQYILTRDEAGQVELLCVESILRSFAMKRAGFVME